MTDPKDKLLKAFNHMVDEFSAAVEKADEKISPTVDEMISRAEHTSKELYALTQDEVKSISEHLKRDISHAREYLNKEGKELSEWFDFDMKLVEDRFANLIAKAADKSWLDFQAFKRRASEGTVYKTGEICSAGTLRCIACGQTMKFTKSNHIPPCPKCHKVEFSRSVDL